MAEPQPTPFEHILIGLVCLSPASGYDLKRIFATTPMGVYQPSSGSIYPALRRLEAQGLVKALDGTGKSARHRRVYEPTRAGRAAHATWLRTPVEVSTVARDLGLHLMRFVMMEHASSREEVLGFLDDLKGALAAFTAGLEGHAAATARLDDRHPALALDHGLAVYRASLRWTRHAIAALRAAPAPSALPLVAGHGASFATIKIAPLPGARRAPDRAPGEPLADPGAAQRGAITDRRRGGRRR